MSDYTPTTEDVKTKYLTTSWSSSEEEEMDAAFDRWLASVKAEAWDEGSRARHEAYMNDSEGFEPVNPHQQVSK